MARGPWGQVGALAFDPQPGVEGVHRRVFEGYNMTTCQEAAARCSRNGECRAELDLGTGGGQGVKGGIKGHVNKSGWMSRSPGFWGWGVQREGRREAKL